MFEAVHGIIFSVVAICQLTIRVITLIETFARCMAETHSRHMPNFLVSSALRSISAHPQAKFLFDLLPNALIVIIRTFIHSFGKVSLIDHRSLFLILILHPRRIIHNPDFSVALAPRSPLSLKRTNMRPDTAECINCRYEKSTRVSEVKFIQYCISVQLN